MSDEPVGQVDAKQVPRYAGLATFARLPRAEDVPRCDVAVLGVPFDSGVTYRPGARFGPNAIREASRLLRPYDPELDVWPFAAQQVADAGDVACSPFDIQRAIAQIYARASAHAPATSPSTSTSSTRPTRRAQGLRKQAA